MLTTESHRPPRSSSTRSTRASTTSPSRSGPDGANSKGALTSLLDSTAKNFDGQGEQFHQTIENLSKFTGTLDDNKEELFGTARQIERFVNALAKNDGTVRRFNDSLASAADLLKDERADLAAALRNLGVAMKAVEGFVKENRQALSQQHQGAQPGVQGPGQAARRARRDRCRSRRPR